MRAEDMTIDERRKYLSKMLLLYLAADRSRKSALLDEMEHVTGMHRKSLLRLIGSRQLARKRHTTPRKRSYGLEVEQVVRVVWESLDYVCVERLRPALLSTARQLARFGELSLSGELEQQLTTISEATLQRMTARMRCERIRLPRKGPTEANRARQQIPMRRIEWDTREAGHFEVDLVHHSGESSAGEYIHSLRWWMWPLDGASGWQ